MILKEKKAFCKKCGKVSFSYYRLGRIIKKRIKKCCFNCIVIPGLKEFLYRSFGLTIEGKK